MARFYLPIPYTIGSLKLPETLAHHAIRVCRMRLNDRLTLFNGQNEEAEAIITAVGKTCYVAIEAIHSINRESPANIQLLQAISSMERMDYTIQKSVELGVSSIQPLVTQRSQPLSAERMQNKLRHWTSLIISAAEQSGRTQIPAIHPPLALEAGLATVQPANTQKWFLDPEAAEPLASINPLSTPPITSIALLIGSEGGFPSSEVHLIKAQGFMPVSLGPRILRTETAGPVAVAICQARFGDLKKPS